MKKLNLRTNEFSGRLIAFEGTDGAGKTTMIEMTKKLLGEKNALFVKQPTDMARKTKLFQKMMYCKNHDDIDYRAVPTAHYVGQDSAQLRSDRTCAERRQNGYMRQVRVHFACQHAGKGIRKRKLVL